MDLPMAVAERREPAPGEARKDHFLRLMLFHPSGVAAGRAAKAPLPEVGRAYTPLRQSKLRASALYHLPDTGSGMPRVMPDSPAVEVMTDLHRVPAVTIGRFATVDDANGTMIAHGVRSLFVVDEQRILGVVTATDILGERPVQVGQQLGIRHDEVLVRDVMTPAESLEVIDFEDVLAAAVGDVVATLKRAGRQHALVIDRPEPGRRQRVRGIFSLTQIARQLGVAPITPEIGRTVAEIEAAFRSSY